MLRSNTCRDVKAKMTDMARDASDIDAERTEFNTVNDNEVTVKRAKIDM